MHRLISFGTFNLEHYNQVDDISSGVTPTSYQSLPEGGALDLFGSHQKHPGAVERMKSLRLRGSSVQEIEQAYFQLLSLRGTRNRLYRRTATGDIHWSNARLVEVSAERSFEMTKYRTIQDLRLRFITQDAFWHGDFGGSWFLDDGGYLDSGLAFDSDQTYELVSSPTEITISIGEDIGRAPTRAIKLRFTAGSAAITSITIARTDGESLTFGGTIMAGDELVIDTGTLQVTNDGVDAYNDLALSPTANLASWFALEPGDNDITITFSGGGTGSTIDLSYYEAWF